MAILRTSSREGCIRPSLSDPFLPSATATMPTTSTNNHRRPSGVGVSVSVGSATGALPQKQQKKNKYYKLLLVFAFLHFCAIYLMHGHLLVLCREISLLKKGDGTSAGGDGGGGGTGGPPEPPSYTSSTTTATGKATATTADNGGDDGPDIIALAMMRGGGRGGESAADTTAEMVKELSSLSVRERKRWRKLKKNQSIKQQPVVTAIKEEEGAASAATATAMGGGEEAAPEDKTVVAGEKQQQQQQQPSSDDNNNAGGGGENARIVVAPETTTATECRVMNARERKRWRRRRTEEGNGLAPPCKTTVVNLDYLPPCRVLIVNTAHWHTETLESIAKLIPVSSLDLDPTKKRCNPTSLVFDYKVRKEHAEPGRLMRTVEWMGYFDQYLRNTTSTKGGVTRHIRMATMLDFEKKTKDTLWKSKRAEYTSKDVFGHAYHSVVEATCYCNKETKSGKDWLADWMLHGESGHSRICIFHEQCPAEYHTPQSLWLSPQHENYFVPSSLPLAGPNPLPQTNHPVICSIGRTDRRNYDYVKFFLEYANAHKEQPFLSRIKFRILGRGDFPLPPEYNATVEHLPDIANDLEFADQIKNGCDALMLLMDPKSHPDYFNQEGSWLKLSGSIPPIIAYQKPFVIHKDLMDLYSKDLLPLNLAHSTFDDKTWTFVPAVRNLFREITNFHKCSNEESLPQPAFKTLAQDIDGLGQCLERRDGQVQELKQYMSSLDLFVVTSGGTGSEALIGHMHNFTNYTVRSTTESQHGNTVHLGSPLFTPLVWDPMQPTVVLMGEFWKAISSMHRRGVDKSRPYLLSRNIAKNLYGAKECLQQYDHYLERYPKDPVGYKSMMWTYMSASRIAGSRTVFLQAPYTQESIDQALRMIGMDDLANQMKSFEVRPRRKATEMKDRNKGQVQDLYKPYEKLEEMFQNELPKVWMASQTPCKLYNYLLHELQDDDSLSFSD